MSDVSNLNESLNLSDRTTHKHDNKQFSGVFWPKTLPKSVLGFGLGCHFRRRFKARGQ
jgi:hypothetical protein